MKFYEHWWWRVTKRNFLNDLFSFVLFYFVCLSSLSWACKIYLIYYKISFMLCFVLVSRINFLAKQIRNMYINKAENYMSFIYLKWNLLIQDYNNSAFISCLIVYFDIRFTWLSQLWRFTTFSYVTVIEISAPGHSCII